MIYSTNPLVSVVIPVYNSEQWIKQTIESVVNQTYDKIEIIIINDGSTDKTLDVLKQFHKLSNLYIYNIENSGPARARNYGVSKAKGEIIAFLDSDDLWEKDKIEKQINYFVENECSLLLTNIKLIDKNNNIIGYQKKEIPSNKTDQAISFFRGEINQNTPTIMVLKSIFNEFQGFNGELLHKEDHYFLLQVAYKYGISVLEEYLVLRRVWDSSMSYNYKKNIDNPTDIITHFNRTRLPFYRLSVENYDFLKPFLRKEIGKYYNNLSHKLLESGHLKEAINYQRRAINSHFKIKYILKLYIMFIPRPIRTKILKFYYN